MRLERAAHARACFLYERGWGGVVLALAALRPRRLAGGHSCCRSGYPICRSTSARCTGRVFPAAARRGGDGRVAVLRPAISGGGGGDIRLVCLQYHVFLASMVLVLLADDAYLFMVAWESMALASYFLVTTDHRIGEIRRAGLLYLVIAHIGALAILLAFGVLQLGQWTYTFAAMRDNSLSPFWASAAFLLALFGFGAKAGFVPLHVWLPEAHPAAPSPVSALMSGVMLKTAIYGLLRVSLDLLSVQQAWWGVVALAMGLLTAFYGVVFAAVQTDMKRLLAYSSIENIGIVLAGVGLTLVFHAYDMELMAALALAATLFHCLNHALFKSLLFLATGSVLHATAQRSLGKLGGLIRRMPWVAALALVGTLAIAGLPPLNGFVSEWMLFQAFLLTPGLPNSYLNMFIPVATAGAGARRRARGIRDGQVLRHRLSRLAARGHSRGARCRPAGARGSVVVCRLVRSARYFPALAIEAVDPIARELVGIALGDTLPRFGMAVPERGRAGPRQLCPARVPRGHRRSGAAHLPARAPAVPWAHAARCALGLRLSRALNPRMQDTAEGFGQPIKQIFEPFFRIERLHPESFRHRSQLLLEARGSAVVLAVPAGSAIRRAPVGAGGGAAPRAHRAVPGVQLRHPADLAAAHPVNWRLPPVPTVPDFARRRAGADGARLGQPVPGLAAEPQRGRVCCSRTACSTS